MFRVPAAPAPDPAALANAADALAAAERPVVIADFATRPPYGWDHVIAIAETLGAPVWDCNSRLNFPSDHLLNLSMAPKECYDGADVVLALDIADFEGPTHVRDIATRTVVNVVPETATWIDIGFTDVEVSKWSMDYGRTFHAHHRMTADPVIGTTQLVALLQERIGRNADLAGKIAARGAEIGKRHQRLRADWRKEAEKHWNKVPMTVPRLALEVWRAIKDEDWVLSAGTLHGWARKLWNFDRPYRHAGRELGTGTQIGISLGVALAYKGSGRLVVDLQPDGDLMYDAGALWMAAKYQIPLLIVMYNNRAYYNDWNHQIVIARPRHRSEPRPYRHGSVWTGARLRRPRPLDGVVGRRSDRERRRSATGASAGGGAGQDGQAGVGRRGDPASMRPESSFRKSRESGECRLSSYARAAKLPRRAPPRRAAGRSQAGGNGHGHATRARPHQD